MTRIWTSPVSVLIYTLVLILQDVPLSNAQQRSRERNKPLRQPPKIHPCEQSSCYPATGNLLIGRESRLSATSTCGVSYPQRYCIVSHLEEKKCFLCDTREATKNEAPKNHRVGQIIYKTKPGTREMTWWQSENGGENVTIQLDLEAEFHFTHLIIVFSTFRPAAMYIDRSYDFGKTWHVYRYFAHNCRDSFPHVSTVLRNITDVICDQRYSGVEPSKNGEVIFRVLHSPNMNIEDPYADHIQNMLKMTNLRVHMTRLHTLGDTLLDDRNEIHEKYYYAISQMVVRGSCSCYGHASRCLPLEGVENTYDMVHGRCECTHHTKGLNCEDCEDFYNDLPWKPAFGKSTNACRQCNCNNHATSCHFDQAVYEHSGGISGGVCDNCQHNTQGQHCESCIPFFYRDPEEDIQSPHICKPCDCDPRGAKDEGICDSISDLENEIVAGACHCKPNVKGRRCDTCKDGFWNLDEKNQEGCQSCTCNILGTIDNLGCNMYTGECTCKRLVTGKDCNECLPETYGLSDGPDGCSYCDCDEGGAYDNFCEVGTGQCKCRPHMMGRTCSTPRQNYFIPNLQIVLEAENTFNTECDSYSSYGNCTVVAKEPPFDRPSEWTGAGYLKTYEGSTLSITTIPVPKTMPYDVVIRYQSHTPGDWEDAVITLIRPDGYDPNGACADAYEGYEHEVPVQLRERGRDTIALREICLEQGKIYKFRITFKRQRNYEPSPKSQIFIDSLVLVPRIELTPYFTGSGPAESRRREFTKLGCNETFYVVNSDDHQRPECTDFMNTVSIFVFDGAMACNCDLTGSMSKKCDEFGGSCQCKTNVVGRQCDQCAPGTYGFSPEGCKACDCNSIGALDNECDLITGQCKCQANTYGRECDQCQLGYWNFPNCQICNCNGHASTCDPRSGECNNCQDSTVGYNCDRCIETYYGNPLLGSVVGCRPCRCPDTVASGHNNAEACQLDERTQDMLCYCNEGYAGGRCDVCAENYYGDPEVPGGQCQQCECNDNVDISKSGNCDGKSGKCLQCLFETDGDHCQYCRNGFYGDAIAHSCRQCDCDFLGTNKSFKHCDNQSGQCPCLSNVVGVRCDRCTVNHWKIASGVGCEACNCDPNGSNSEQCNEYDGQCDCKQGFGGRQCDQCEADYYGDPNDCKSCKCNVYGSEISQCDRQTGQCKCNKGMGGIKCDVCDRGFYGEAPYCTACGECFDNWDLILNSLQNETAQIIAEAKQIKSIGATGAYTKEFDSMEKQLNVIQKLLANATVTPDEINRISSYQTELRKGLNASLEAHKVSERHLDELRNAINLNNFELDSLKQKSEAIKLNAAELKDNATKLQEANVEGALNLTRAALGRVRALDEDNRQIELINAEVERQCKRTDATIERNRNSTAQISQENEDSIKELGDKIRNLTAHIPDINEHVCGARGDPCDSLCGGAGCDRCGGLSCDKGALSKANKALEFATDTDKNIKEKEETANTLIRSLSQAKSNASDAHESAKMTHAAVEGFYNRTTDMLKTGNERLDKLVDIMNNQKASPEEIEGIAKKTLALDLQLDPEEIQSLAEKIDNTVSSLENVEEIIANTQYDLDRVEGLKQNAVDTKKRADDVLEMANKVVKALSEAEDAQIKAKDSIQQATSDVQLAENDLGQIDKETVDAQLAANKTANEVAQYKNRLNEVSRRHLKNDRDAKEIEDKAETVKSDASTAYLNANKMRDEYKYTNDTLNERARTSEDARQRAQELLQRASKITVDTNGKLKELQEIANAYQSNEFKLGNLEQMAESIEQSIATNLNKIQIRSDNYRQCST